MEDEITTQEALKILQRLVRERQALERGLEVASKLASAENAILERNMHISALDGKIKELESSLAGTEAKFAQKLAEAQEKFDHDETLLTSKLQALLADVKDAEDKVSSARANYNRDAQNAVAAQAEWIAKHSAEKSDLSNTLTKLREELRELRRRATTIGSI